MNNNKNQISIRIKGSRALVLETLEKIEKLFPVSVRSAIYPNSDDDGVHVFLNVAVLEAVPE